MADFDHVDPATGEFYHLYFHDNRYVRLYQDGRREWHDTPRTVPSSAYDASAYALDTGREIPAYNVAQGHYGAAPYQYPSAGPSTAYQSSFHQVFQDDYTQMRLQTGPPNDITDPTIIADFKLAADLKLKGDPEGAEGDAEYLDPSYKIKPRRWFKVGKVLKVLWSEPAGYAQSRATTVTTRWGEQVATKIRWFVIIRISHDSCSCLPIQTYDGRGCAAPNAFPQNHAIIYTGDYPPAPLPEEVAQDRGSMTQSIKVNPKQPYDKLHHASRLNYHKIYTVEYNVKVYDFGKVDSQWEAHLLYNFDSASNNRTRVPTPEPIPGGTEEQ